MKRILSLLALVLVFSACQDKSKFSVTGVIKGETKKHIYISRLDVDTPIIIDSAKINSKGEFKFRIKASYADFYQLGFSGSDFITILAEPGEKINLLFEGKNLFENYKITGSEGSEKLQILDNILADTKRKLDSLNTLYTEASKEQGFDVAGPKLEEQYYKILKEQRMKNIDFIIKNTNSLASIKAVYQRFTPDAYVLYDPKDLQFMKILTDSLTLHHPHSKHVQALAQDFSKEMNNMYISRFEQIARDKPPTKLDPDLKNVDGKRITLSSLRGKYVLLTFWSIKSQECISENIQLKQYYQLYKNKGFEIYQINIDNDENAWKTAVKFDELPWVSTREDDPTNPVNAMIFNVKAVPTNYLFDKEGTVIGTNLHGRSLQIKLDQLFNK
jgi:thiol-disulfide isomerase/thioredoxin